MRLKHESTADAVLSCRAETSGLTDVLAPHSAKPPSRILPQRGANMKLIGITGGVGSGKSEILRYLKKTYRCRVLLADEAAMTLEEPGGALYGDLTALLEKENREREEAGEEIVQFLLEDGSIDRKGMAKMIFLDGALLEKVNALVHPAVRKYILSEVASEREKGELDYFFLEAALLIECGYNAIVDEMWYIYCEESVRRKRLKESRGYSDERIDGIMRSQLSEEEFRKGSGFVIDNSGALEDAFSQIDAHLSSGKDGSKA